MLTATQLVRWADQRRSQEMLPLLVRRLVLASVNPSRIDFAAGDSVSRPGCDGFLQTDGGHPFVPAGRSIWEMGVNQSPQQKAEADYAKRTAHPGAVRPRETAFVFVTPRRWQGKSEWAAGKNADGAWAEVRVIDADDLEQWLDLCPAVASWGRSQIVGTPPDGLTALSDEWEALSSRTTPRLSPALFLAGRGDAAQRVRAWFADPPRPLRVRADAADEAVGFLAAVVQSLDESRRGYVHARAVRVSTPEAWRAAAGSGTPLFIVASTPDLGPVAQAVDRGHRVFLAYGNDSGGVAVDVHLGHLRRAELEDALRGMGVGEDRRDRVAGESRGRVAALVDLLGCGTARPRWADPAVAPDLVPFLLAGSWGAGGADADAVLGLCRLPADEVARRLARWANESDPPVRLVGGTWEWISRERAWPHLSRFVTADDLAAFRRTAAAVLGESDPRRTLPPDDRWRAAIFDRGPRYTEALRRGLAGGLAAMATRPTGVNASADPAGFAAAVVRDVFGPTPDPERWYSLAPVLPLLAEAAPDAFLSAVERDVLGDAGVRDAIFQEEGMFGGSRLCHLLWALETLAWSPILLPRVGVALAGLAAVDPGGRTANRPDASLRTVLLPWMPQTLATVGQRLAVLDAVHTRHPAVAFDLCVRLMPDRSEVTTPTPRPRWRPWADGYERGVLTGDYWECVVGLIDRAVAWAGRDQGRWSRLLHPLPAIPRDRLDRLLAGLAALPLEQLADDGGDLRKAVREVLHRRRTVEAVYPNLTAADDGRLEAVYARLEPGDLVRRHAWLFDRSPSILTVNGNDWRAEQAALDRERQEVVRQFDMDRSAESYLRLADAAEQPRAVGFYASRSARSDEIAARLADCLDQAGGTRNEFARGFIGGSFGRDGWPWVHRVAADLDAQSWPEARRAGFALALPFDATTWDWVEGWGDGTAAGYWRAVTGWTREAADAPRAVRTLLAHGRPGGAIDIIESCLNSDGHREVIEPALLLAALQALTTAACDGTLAAEGVRRDGGFGYGIGQLISAVERSGITTEAELARIEWAWFPVLDHNPRRGPTTLCRLLANNPGFFAEVLGMIHRPRHPDRDEEDAPEPDAAARSRATQAWQLLHHWQGIPGQRDDGGVDADALLEWVTATRQILHDSGHAAVGDQEIGNVLARAPVGADGVWPCECVRELLESVRSDDLDKGVYIGVLNGRGVTCRAPSDGGEQEVRLAEQYAGWAASLAASAPRASKILGWIADNYRLHAKHEDDRRDLNEFG